MRIVRIIGGLGNQMFQYAFALALQNVFSKEEIYIDTYAFNGYPLHNGYLLNRIFTPTIPVASKSKILKLNYPFFHYRLWQIGKRICPRPKSVFREKEDMIYDKTVYSLHDSTYYDGYWQSEAYFSRFSQIIRDNFNFPKLDTTNKEFIQQFKNQNTVAIHVRRGDYLKEPLFRNIADHNYYLRAINTITQLTRIDRFIVFSNDIVWSKNHIPCMTTIDCEFVDWNVGMNAYKDMQLMSLCKHNIIANSSFSWWGAWLNNTPDKIVISPKIWTNNGKPNDIIPPSWIKV